jgi:hypothetical protein
VAAILVGVLKCRTQFWKRTTQESFQQSLVEIGSVVSIFSNGGHLGYRTALTDTILKGDHLRIISAKFGSVVSEEKIFFTFHPPFSIFCFAAILVGSRDHRTQIWKRAIQGSFHKSLVAIGPVVSEEKIFM